MISLRAAGAAFVLLAGLAACTPTHGPSGASVDTMLTTQQDGITAVVVDDKIIASLPRGGSSAFPGAWTMAAPYSPDETQPGDRIRVAVFEPTGAPLMGDGVGGNTALADLEVEGDGSVFVPYAGKVPAAGSTLADLRGALTTQLSSTLADPQVVVARTKGDVDAVSVMGSVASGGAFPLTHGLTRLSAALARAGGPSIAPDTAVVHVMRNGTRASTHVAEIFRNPSQDIALRPGDKILVEADNRRVLVLGATGIQKHVPFDRPVMGALDAVAAASGLDGRQADPSSIFVLRQKGAQRTVYLLNLRTATGMFQAQAFPLQDRDVVYASEAPLSQWNKIVAGITGTGRAVGAFD